MDPIQLVRRRTFDDLLSLSPSFSRALRSSLVCLSQSIFSQSVIHTIASFFFFKLAAALFEFAAISRSIADSARDRSMLKTVLFKFMSSFVWLCTRTAIVCMRANHDQCVSDSFKRLELTEGSSAIVDLGSCGLL